MESKTFRIVLDNNGYKGFGKIIECEGKTERECGKELRDAMRDSDFKHGRIEVAEVSHGCDGETPIFAPTDHYAFRHGHYMPKPSKPRNHAHNAVG